MKVLLKQLEAHLPVLKVFCIKALPGLKGIEITLSVDGKELRLITSDFEIGRRGAKTAALARFAAASGFGDAEAIYKFLIDFPSDMTGVLFAAAGSIEECVGPGSPNWTTELVA